MTSSKAAILVVDDIRENIDILVGILDAEYQVKVARNGEKALRIAAAQAPPDLILLDVMMPDMDGFTVCRQLKAAPRTARIPVIFVTAKDEIQDETLGFELGAVDYIAKPVSPPVVLARVKTHLALQDQKRHLESLVQERTLELNETRLEIIRRLGRAAEYRDNETGLHVLRMSHYSHLMALGAGLSTDEAELLLQAAPMHDVGKIGIPDHILLKPGPLDEREWQVIRKHPYIGAVIIGDQQNELLRAAHTIAYSHHEKWDGSGYPRRLRDEDISRWARIVAIADVFDALTTRRPYKPAWETARALEHIRADAGKHFAPRLVNAFFEVLPDIFQVMAKYAESEPLNVKAP
ncbi:HD-GYP domain-containing protein [Chromobacterium sphagni]|uniref:Two-component system response regulator n=1 Tax=Chromobacterium sphagni TaxID=1903179 RepID=A0ABX3CBH3_9NEIS|nr:HD domain-containing phosphohydrolase [Chromobacterium sphagni]OHX19639.1 two-component system response regulator [Chromobacterium sphagni]